MEQTLIKNAIQRDEILSRISKRARESKAPLFLVGGFIRDLLLGTSVKDYDFTLPKESSSFIPVLEETLGFHFFKVGQESLDHITYRMIQKDKSFDLTFFKGKTIEEDLGNRDFTMNAIAFSFLAETLQGVEGSLEDIRGKRIRAVSPQAIDQDPLRILRAVRYLCTLENFMLDPALKEEIVQKKNKLIGLPGERIKAELDQMFLSPCPETAIQSLFETNVLFTLFPELKGLETLGQDEPHPLDILPHILLIIEKLTWAFQWTAHHYQEVRLIPEDRLTLYYAALFHDLGKQNTYSKNETGKVHFYHHERFSVHAAEKIMERFHFSNVTKQKVLRLIQNHMRILNLSQEAKETALKRLVYQMGDETPLLVLLSLADKEASHGILSAQTDEVVEGHCLRILELFEEKDIVHPSPFVTGHDVIELGYLPGPKIGQILDFVRQKQVEGEIKNREEALKVLREKFAIEE